MNFKIKPGLVIVAVIALVGIIGGFSFYGFYNSTRNEGIAMESSLSGQYLDNQNELAAAAMQISETLGIAGESADKVNSIWADAIAGRYDNKMGGSDGEGSLVNALSIVEASPDVNGLILNYSKVQDVVISSRNAFKNKQTKMQDRAVQYNTWLKSGVFRSQIVKSQGFPSDDLKVKLGDGTVIYGRAALEKMTTPIVDASTADAFDTGIMKPIITPGAETK